MQVFTQYYSCKYQYQRMKLLQCWRRNKQPNAKGRRQAPVHRFEENEAARASLPPTPGSNASD